LSFVNIYDPKDRLALFELHNERRKQFHRLITESPVLTDARLVNVARCSRCRDP